MQEGEIDESTTFPPQWVSMEQGYGGSSGGAVLDAVGCGLWG
jgi:hypothetical protein